MSIKADYYESIENNDIDTFIRIINSGRIDPFIEDNAALIKILNKNNIPFFKILSSHKDFNPCFLDNHALIISCHSGYIEILKIILNFNIDYSENVFAFIAAAQENQIEIIKILLKDSRFDPTHMGNIAISSAYQNEHSKSVDLLWTVLRIKQSLFLNNEKLHNELIKKDITSKIKKF
jgi:hypothetical protein